MSRGRVVAFVLVCVALLCGLPGCKKRKPTVVHVNLPGQPISKRLHARYKMHPIDRSLPAARDIAAYVKPLRRRLNKTMDQVLARTPRALERGKPESVIGNLVADIALAHLQHMKKPVDVFITNLGGIRNDLAAGPITLRAVYECLPFENVVVRVQVAGKALLAIITMLAKRGGEPVAGMRFQVRKSNHKVLRIRVRGRRIKPKAMYWVGTSDYVARTGFLKPFLKGIKLDKTALLLRDSVVWGLRRKPNLRRLRRDGRIKYRK